MAIQATPATQSGELVRITFSVSPLAVSGQSANINITKAKLNEVQVSTVENGYVRISDSSPSTRPEITDEGALTNQYTQLFASWVSSDFESGISEYQYAVSDTSGRLTIVPWTSAGTNQSMTITGLSLQHGMTYYIWVKAKNGDGLWSEAGYSDGIKVDIKPPVGSIKINNPLGSRFTKSRTVILYLSAYDLSGVVRKMMFSENYFNWSAAEIYTATKSFTFSSPGDGTKTIYVKYQDEAGNWTTPYLASIILDTTVPVGIVTINSNAATTASPNVTLYFTVLEKLSGPFQVAISNDNINWSTQSYSQIKSWALSPGFGTKTVYAKLQDNAGNWSNVFSNTISYSKEDEYKRNSTLEKW
jgi:hypothetical protein